MTNVHNTVTKKDVVTGWGSKERGRVGDCQGSGIWAGWMVA